MNHIGDANEMVDVFDGHEDGRRNYDHYCKVKRHELLRQGKTTPVNDEERRIAEGAGQ